MGYQSATGIAGSHGTSSASNGWQVESTQRVLRAKKLDEVASGFIRHHP